MNRDPHDQPGQHRLALWSYQNMCEVLDSYALPPPPPREIRASYPVERLDCETLEVYGDQRQVPSSRQ